MTDGLTCCRPECAAVYPIVDGRPVLIDEERSIFTIADIVGRRQTTYRQDPTLRRLAKRILPDLTLNFRSRANYAQLKSLLLARSPGSRVLVVGGRSLGRGMEPITTCDRIELIETDVTLEDRIRVVCDGHGLPFKSCSMSKT